MYCIDAAREELDRISSHKELIFRSTQYVSDWTGITNITRVKKGVPTVLAALILEGQDPFGLLPHEITPLLAVLVGLVDLLDDVDKHDVNEVPDFVLFGLEKEDQVEHGHGALLVF